MDREQKSFIENFRAMSSEEKLEYVRSCRVTDRSDLPAEARDWFEKTNALIADQHDSKDHPPLCVTDRRISKAG